MFKPTFWQSFTLQTSLSFALLVLITALAVGLPTAWLLKRQTEQHIRDLLVQSTTTTQTLLANRQTNLQNLALLTAQRPTLTILLQANNQKALEDYLTTLQGGAGVDAVVICDAQRIVAQTSPVLTACPGTTDQLFYSNHAATVWLFASEIITLPARVLVGYRLDADFLRTIGQESGLALFLWQTQQLLAHSVAELPPSPNVAEFIVQGTRYRSHTVTLLGSVTESNLQLQIALPINTLMANQQQLNRWLGGLLVIVISSGLLFGAGLSQRINRPLGQLYTAAVTMRQGNLAQPIQVKSNLQEVIQVAQALDETRTALQHSLSELQNQKEWHDHLLAGIVEGIITLDAKHKITFFSQGAEKITACSASQALGHHCNEILRLENTNQLFSQHLPAIGQTKKIPIWLQEHSVTLAISASQFLLPNTDVTQTVLVLRDISEAEILPRLLGNFLANIAHEFRTPLSALSASVELLNEQHEQLSPGELRELLTALHLGTLSLQTLIDNLLEGASIETGQFRVSAHPAQLTDIINTVLFTLKPLFEKYHQTVQLECPDGLPDVIADTRRSEQAFVNLLANAIKWNAPAGTVTIRVEPTALPNQALGSNLKVTITDQGPGLPAQTNALFKRFGHFDDHRSRAQAGAGLGLSVVKAIITAQGGSVGAENSPTGGASFWLTFRVVEAEI